MPTADVLAYEARALRATTRGMTKGARHVGSGNFYICNNRRGIRHSNHAGVQHAAALSRSRPRNTDSDETYHFSRYH